MPQSLSQVYLHLVFSTKHRQPFLFNSELRLPTHAYLGSTCHGLGCMPLAIGGVEDHVHILCVLSRTRTIADLVRDVKRASSRWLKTRSADLTAFDWQNGYGAFSVGPAEVETVCRYIATQQEHHRNETFQEEYRRQLQEAGITWDERYVWD